MRMSIDASLLRKITKRLSFLEKTSRQEQPNQTPMSESSLLCFIYFLILIPNLKYPDIVLTPSGQISAQWRESRAKHFALRFLENGSVVYVIFAPDPNYPEKTIRCSGECSVDSLMKIVHPYGVMEWTLY